MKTMGNPIVDIDGTGTWSNSDCGAYSATCGGDSLIDIEGGSYSAAGGIDACDDLTADGGIIPDLPKVPPFPLPVPDCTGYPQITDTIDPDDPDHPGVRKLTPGYTNGGVKFNTPGQPIKFAPGLYCIYGDKGFVFANGNVIEEHAEGVMFYVTNGPVNISGGDVILKAPTPADPLYDSAGISWEGMLFYVTSGGAVTINGNENSYFEGTVYAPDSECTLNGGGNTRGYDLSVVCNIINLGGGAELYIDFDNANHYQPPTTIDLIE
jgi:hypothetical protein